MIPSADSSSPPLRLLFGASLDLRPGSISMATKSPSLSLWPSVWMPQPPSRPFLRHHPPVCASPAGAKTSFNTQ